MMHCKAQDPTPTRQPAKVITKIWDAYHLHKTPGGNLVHKCETIKFAIMGA